MIRSGGNRDRRRHDNLLCLADRQRNRDRAQRSRAEPHDALFTEQAIAFARLSRRGDEQSRRRIAGHGNVIQSDAIERDLEIIHLIETDQERRGITKAMPGNRSVQIDRELGVDGRDVAQALHLVPIDPVLADRHPIEVCADAERTGRRSVRFIAEGFRPEVQHHIRVAAEVEPERQLIARPRSANAIERQLIAAAVRCVERSDLGLEVSRARHRPARGERAALEIFAERHRGKAEHPDFGRARLHDAGQMIGERDRVGEIAERQRGGARRKTSRDDGHFAGRKRSGRGIERQPRLVRAHAPRERLRRDVRDRIRMTGRRERSAHRTRRREGRRAEQEERVGKIIRFDDARSRR